MTTTRLLGTNPNQVAVGGDLGELAFQDNSSVNILGGTASLTQAQLNAITLKEIDITASQVFLYDTRKDSDGGAWRFRCQHTSWYNEELNTDLRGVRREFPSVAIISISSLRMTIYDADDPTLPMWMILNRFASAHSYDSCSIFPDAGALTSVAAVNGIIAVSQVGDSKGLTWIKFIEDAAYTVPATYWGYGKFRGNIAQRNTTPGYKPLIAGMLLHGQGYSNVAMAVLPNAPIDPATGLPKPTMAIGTNTGVGIFTHYDNVINYNVSFYGHSVAINPTSPYGPLVTWCWGDAHAQAAFMRDAGFSDDVQTYSANYTSGVANYNGNKSTGYYPYFFGGSTSVIPVYTGPTGFVMNDSTVYHRYEGVNSKTSYDNPRMALDNSMGANWNSGWNIGDSKISVLNGTDSEVIEGYNLVTNGTFSNTTGWAANGSGGTTFSATGGRLRVVRNGGSGTGEPYTTLANTIPGKQYIGSVEVFGTAMSVGVSNTPSGAGGDLFAANLSVGKNQFTFVATARTTYIRVLCDSDGTTSEIDNLVVTQGETNKIALTANRGIQFFGNVYKTPVAPNSDLMGYNLTSDAYAIEPLAIATVNSGSAVNNASALGTNWSCMFWLKRVDTATWDIILSRSGPSASHGDGIGFQNPSGGLKVQAGGVGVQDPTSEGVYWKDWTGGWQFCVVTCDSSGIKFYHEGIRTYATSTKVNFTFPDSTYYWAIGCEHLTSYNSNPIDGRDKHLALFRLSATVPTEEQIKKIYEDEKVLFNENAKCTTGVNNPTSLAYDQDTKLIYVGNSAGRYVFDGLRRVENTTVAVGNSISASNGLVAEE